MHLYMEDHHHDPLHDHHGDYEDEDDHEDDLPCEGACAIFKVNVLLEGCCMPQ